MKAIYLTLCIVLAACTSISAQNAYYDALFVSSLRKDDFKLDDLSDLTAGERQILKELENFQAEPFKLSNPLPDFVRSREIFRKLRAQGLFAAGASSMGGFQAAGLISPLLNLSKLSTAQLDTVLYGLTIFFADEFRRNYVETYIWGVDRSIGRLGELQVLFPATYRKMRSFDPIRYKELGNELKLVFDEDLGALPDNLIAHLESTDNTRFGNKKFLLLTDKVCQKLRSQPSFNYLKVSSVVAKKLISGVHPSDIIAYLDETYYREPDGIVTAEPLDQFGRRMHLLNILQRNLRDTTTIATGTFTNVWLNFEKLNKLNTVAKKGYFMALLYREDARFFDTQATDESARLRLPADVKFDGSSGLFDSTATFANAPYTARFNTFKRFEVDSLLSVLVRLDEFIRIKNKDLMTEQNFLPLMKMTGELISLGLHNPTDRAKAALYTGLITDSFEIYNAIRVKNYANLTTHVGSVLNRIVTETGGGVALSATVADDFIGRLNLTFPTDYNILKEQVNQFDVSERQSVKHYLDKSIKNKKAALSAADVEREIKAALAASPAATTVQELVQRLDKISAFTSGIVSATTSEGVKDVISQFASPQASYREKREHFFTISLGGMPGLFVGREKFVEKQVNPEPVATNARVENKPGNVIGLSLPIGLDFSFSFNRDRQQDIRKKVASWGVFASFIDLGSMLNYRLSSRSNTLPDKVTWKDIFSPGLGLNLGLPNTPLTIGVGYQYAPKLRGIVSQNDKDSDTADVVNRFNANRVQLRIAYDIPLFTIVRTRR